MSVTPALDAPHRHPTDATARRSTDGAHPADATHRASTAAPTGRFRRPPRLTAQAVVVALVPALVWLLAHPAAVLAAAATLVVAAAATALARERRRAGRPAPAVE